MDRFELESRIMDCWSVVEDVKTVLRMADHREVGEDELANALLGIHTLYQMKFEQLWATFEKMTHDDNLDHHYHSDDLLENIDAHVSNK